MFMMEYVLLLEIWKKKKLQWSLYKSTSNKLNNPLSPAILQAPWKFLKELS